MGQASSDLIVFNPDSWTKLNIFCDNKLKSGQGVRLLYFLYVSSLALSKTVEEWSICCKVFDCILMATAAVTATLHIIKAEWCRLKPTEMQFSVRDTLLKNIFDAPTPSCIWKCPQSQDANQPGKAICFRSKSIFGPNYLAKISLGIYYLEYYRV